MLPPTNNAQNLPNPPATNTPNATNAIKAVAGYEIIKGLAALALAVSVFIWHSHLPDIAAHLVRFLHHIFGHFFSEPLDSISRHADQASENWQKAFWFIIGYTVLRFLEAYGLYKDKTWAYWYSVLGYGIFIPIELYSILKKPELFTILTFLLNVVIVIVVYLNMKKKGLLGKRQ